MSALTGWDTAPPAVLLVLGPAGLFALGRFRLLRHGVRRPVYQDLAFAGGVLCLAVAIVSPVAAYDERFPVHVVQHLLLGMAAPLGFALAAPLTLALRTAPPGARRLLVRVLGSRCLRGLGWAPVGAVLSVGGMWVLYLTPLYALTLRHPVLHDLVHAHMLVSGCLLTFALVGSDPMPGRGRPATRLGTLFLALAAHDILAKYLYVHAADLAAAQPGSGSTASWRLGAQWLWYGGDLLDVLITVILCARWYSAAGRELRRQVRRSHLPTGSDLESG